MNLFSRETKILLRELVKTDFKLRYQGSAIGYLWSILKPIMLFAIMYVVFIRFLRFGEGVPHFAVSLLLGMVAWTFFSEATSMGMMSVVNRGDLLRKLNFSKQVIVLSAVIGAMINFAINAVVVLIFALINGVRLSLEALWIFPLTFELAILCYGVALILSGFFVRYRDIAPIWEVVMQAGMYATPIIYPLTLISNTSMLAAKAVMMNPLAQIIQDMRHVLIDHNNIAVWEIVHNPFLIAVPYILPFVVFAFGYWYFNRNAKYFAEIL